jgi:hypothetical protein
MPSDDQSQSASMERQKIGSDKLLAAIREWAPLAIVALCLIIVAMHYWGLSAAPSDTPNVEAKAKLEFIQLISARGLMPSQTAQLYHLLFPERDSWVNTRDVNALLENISRPAVTPVTARAANGWVYPLTTEERDKLKSLNGDALRDYLSAFRNGLFVDIVKQTGGDDCYSAVAQVLLRSF